MAKRVNIGIPTPPNIQVNLVGDWEKVQYLLSNLDNSIKKGYDNGIDNISRKLLSIIRTAIISGQPPENSGVTWEPLSPTTLKRRPNEELYYLTGLFYRSIGLYKYKSRTLVGLAINNKRPNSNLTLNQLALILEYGSETKHIPARPLFKPSLKSFGGTKKISEILIRAIKASIVKETGISSRAIKIKLI